MVNFDFLLEFSVHWTGSHLYFPFSDASARPHFSIRSWGTVSGKSEDWENPKDFLHHLKAIVGPH